eukprot:TRINITY_DN29_c0_g1_i5.p1 TRINITY_DN29_c0_g1~~TRINITY_DN29_c0_g1_i5.p1  ORF type:complete len:152 (-),score=33.95 TRINITY_DN29_c0_g1_i5:656-1111(-)
MNAQNTVQADGDTPVDPNKPLTKAQRRRQRQREKKRLVCLQKEKDDARRKREMIAAEKKALEETAAARLLTFIKQQNAMKCFAEAKIEAIKQKKWEKGRRVGVGFMGMSLQEKEYLKADLYGFKVSLKMKKKEKKRRPKEATNQNTRSYTN